MYYVYIITNYTNTVLYIGVTNNLQRRIYEHKNKLIEGFSSRYNVNKLVYFETTSDVKSAIEREKVLKKWARVKKCNLVEASNPMWQDLSESLSFRPRCKATFYPCHSDQGRGATAWSESSPKIRSTSA